MINKIEIIELEKHEDKRGILLKILKNSDIENKEFGEIYFTSLHPGIIRANHYHEKTTEWFCVLNGKGKLVLRNNETNETTQILMDNKKVVKIPINVSHAIKNTGDEEMSLLVYSDLEYNEKNPDSISIDLLKE